MKRALDSAEAGNASKGSREGRPRVVRWPSLFHGMERAGFDAETLAQALGTPTKQYEPRTIDAYVLGERTPTVETLCRLAALLGVEAGDLLKDWPGRERAEKGLPIVVQKV